jgi:lincosamide and streptogramin A transport system ATP-binding/permease protein
LKNFVKIFLSFLCGLFHLVIVEIKTRLFKALSAQVDGGAFLIALKHVTFGYDEKTIFEDVSLSFDASWKLALVGRNGRGKTTLMRLLLGELPFSGRIQSDVSFLYFPQTVTDKSQLTKFILDELYDAEDWQIQRELNLLGLSEDILWRPFETLSGGEQTKVLLAGLFLDEGNFPLIDEPTNHLDAASRAKIASYLQGKKSGYIVVSHDRQFLDEVSDHLLAIERNGLELLASDFSTYEAQKKRRDAFEWAENDKLKSEIGRLKQTARDKAEWSRGREKDKYGDPHKKGSGAVANSGFIGARAARMMKKSKVLEHRMTAEISEKEKLLKNLEKVDALSMAYQPTHHKRLLDEEDLTVVFDGHALFSPINLQQSAGQITAITGENGIGKSQLLRQVIALAESKHLKISYVRQIYEDNQGDLKSFSDQHQLDYTAFLNNLRKLGMEREVFAKKIEQMSMGQQKKVELAKSLSQSAELFIWDEPLNYLDVFNHEQIENLLKTVKPAMIVVEHDATFVKNVADTVIALQKLSD